jgi:hypothetical protein
MAGLKRLRCDAGARYDHRGQVHYACSEDGVIEVVMNGDVLLIVYCERHAAELAVPMVARSRDLRLEAISW